MTTTHGRVAPQNPEEQIRELEKKIFWLKDENRELKLRNKSLERINESLQSQVNRYRK